MHKETKAALLVLLLTATPSLLAAEPPQSPSPEALARQVFELTGGAYRIERGLQDMAEAVKQRDPDVPAEFLDEFFASVDKDHIIDLMIPVYIRNLTVEEMKAAIEFYSTPEGKSLARKLPIIGQEGAKVGAAWGEELSQKFAERLAKYKQEHPES